MARHDGKRSGAATGTSNIQTPVVAWSAYLGGGLAPPQLLAGSINGQNAFIRASGGSVAAVLPDGTVLWTVLTHGSPTLVGIVDLAGDGRQEVIAFTSTDTWAIDLATGKVSWIQPPGEMGTIGTVRVADMNGDGHPDLVIGEARGSDGAKLQTGYIYSFGSGFSAPVRAPLPYPNAAAGPENTPANMDGTGGNELVLRGIPGTLAVVDSTGNLLATTPDLQTGAAPVAGCVAANIGAGPTQQVVCVASTSSAPAAGAGDTSRVFAVKLGAGTPPTLDVAWSISLAPTAAISLAYNDLAVDLAGDGNLETVITAYDAGGNPTVHILNAATGAELGSIPGGRLLGDTAPFPAGGRLMATRGASDISLWAFDSAGVHARGTLADYEHRPVPRLGALPGLVGVVLPANHARSRRRRDARSDHRQPDPGAAHRVGPGLGPADDDRDHHPPAGHARDGGVASPGDGSRLPPARPGRVGRAPPAPRQDPGLHEHQRPRRRILHPRRVPRAGLVPGGERARRHRGSDPGPRQPPRAPAAGRLRGDGHHAPGGGLAAAVLHVAGDRGGARRLLGGHLRSPRRRPDRGRPAVHRAAAPRRRLRRVGGPHRRPPGDLLLAHFTTNGVPDVAIQSGASSSATVTTSGLSGADGHTLWSSAVAGCQLEAGMSLVDWNGDGIDNAVFQSNGTFVSSGVDGTQLAGGGPTDCYALPVPFGTPPSLVYTAADIGTRAYAHDLMTAIFTSMDQDQPFPYGAIAACPSGTVLLEGSATAPAQLAITALDGSSPGSTINLFLASGGLYPDEMSAYAVGSGQLTAVNVHADLTGNGQPTAVVGSSDGWLYAIDPCTGTLTFTYSFGAPVGEPVFGDTDGDGNDEIIVSVDDGYLYALKNGPQGTGGGGTGGGGAGNGGGSAGPILLYGRAGCECTVGSTSGPEPAALVLAVGLLAAASQRLSRRRRRTVVG